MVHHVWLVRLRASECYVYRPIRVKYVENQWKFGVDITHIS